MDEHPPTSYLPADGILPNRERLIGHGGTEGGTKPSPIRSRREKAEPAGTEDSSALCC
jgi:hypothetical protein